MPLDPFRHYDTVQFLKQHEAARMAKPQPEISMGATFDDLLDIVNPLQHLPVVGTLYRAVTGDKMAALPKIAGDTLYGGVWGAVSALADTAFEAITGKDFGSTVLALVTDGFGPAEDKPVALAKAPARPEIAPALESDAGIAAFSNALAAKGIDSAMSARALYAYRRSQGMADDAAGLQ